MSDMHFTFYDDGKKSSSGNALALAKKYTNEQIAQIPLKAQTASYVICAEDSVNKEGAIVVANPTTMPNGLENNLQYALNAIFDSEDFINGAEIVIRRGTYFGNSGYANYVDLKIYKACTIRFEDTRQQQYIRVIYLDSTRAEGTYGKSGFINLIGAYCSAIDIGVRGCVVEDCVVLGEGDTYTSGAIVVSRRNNTIRNNCVPYIYFTGSSETMYAEKCHCYGNKANWGDRATPTTYVQADGFIDTEGDIYEVNDIEGTAYIKSLIPVKSVSANGAELTPDDVGNVDIPLASASNASVDDSVVIVPETPLALSEESEENTSGNDGLMSKEDKKKLDGIEDEAQVNIIEKIKLGDTEATVKDKTVTVPYAKSVEQTVVTTPVEGIPPSDPMYEYFGGMITATDKEKLETLVPGRMSKLPTNHWFYEENDLSTDEETGATTATVTMSDNEHFTISCDVLVLSRGVSVSNGYSSDDWRHTTVFNAEVIWKTGTSLQPQIQFPSEWVFVGTDVEDKVLIPQMNMIYTILLCEEGTQTVAYVSGYEAPTEEVSE